MHAFESEHIQKLRPCLAECMVLLRANGAFPLQTPCKIAAFGDGVRNTVKGGTGSGEVNSRYFVTIEQGLESAGFTIANGDWPDRYAPFIERARKNLRKSVWRRALGQKVNPIVASMGAVLKAPEYEIELDFSADAAIYVVARLSGEGNDRLPEKGDFQLTDSEVRDIRALDRAYDRFMLIVNAGGPIDLTPVADVGNILVASQLGVETGAAVADVLLGNSYPSGKLATTWAAYADYGQVGDFAQPDDTRYREGIFVGYRSFDAACKKPLFPFGFGLGYTTFELGSCGFAADGPIVHARVEVANTGAYRGKETVQLYVSFPQGELVREVKSLAGFAKTRELSPGERCEVGIEFDVRDLAAFDVHKARYVLEAGVYAVCVGTSSANAQPRATFELGRDVVVRTVERLFDAVNFEDADLRVDGCGEGLDPADLRDLPSIGIDESTLAGPEGFKRQGKPSIPELSLLSDEALAYLGIGAFDPDGGPFGIIGNASQSVAGAAGESTAQLESLGIGSLVMADGPAGLRLARRYYEDARGVHAVGSLIPESMLEMLPAPARALLSRLSRPPKGVELKEQFTTALPIATAIAQSFNLQFAELCGNIVGAEMKRFGVDLWLAPALNVHRNVLCGRNFEYFSEDPLVSGKFAAALTRGVQAHPGRGTTVKHFAANNQETNRYANNSIVSERALREMYLKGFGICIREAAPRALMTSYNLVNGTHTSESLPLARILRHEFGFGGVIMTDWIVGGDLLTSGAKYPGPNPAKVAAAGCSLFMPGSKKDHEALLAGLKSGSVTRAQLERNAAYLLRTLWEMRAER